MKTYKLFLESISNTVTSNDIISLLEKDCSKFLEELRKAFYIVPNNELFYRGFQETITDFKKLKRIENRIPVDSPSWLHNYANEELYKKFNWSPRSNGVFATTNKKIAKHYNKSVSVTGPVYSMVSTEPYLFFPIGEYKYIFNPNVLDLYTEFEERQLFPEDDQFIITDILGYYDYDENVYSKEKIEEINKRVKRHKEKQQKEIVDIFNDYQDYDLSDSYSDHVEVVFDCEEYYLIDITFLDDIKNHIYNIS